MDDTTERNFSVMETAISRDGFAMLHAIFAPAEVAAMQKRLENALQAHANRGSIRSRGGVVYAARNLLDVFPELPELCLCGSALTTLLTRLLGHRAGLVRGLFFDKPPEQSWSLPWHQDRTIAVVDNQIDSPRFRNPTRKAGIPHIEADGRLLQSMATARIHLDDAAEDNGALQVLPGSHAWTDWIQPKKGRAQVGELVRASAGDVLLMRPLLAHCSGVSDPLCERRRRIIHLEFAAAPELPDGFQWRHFLPLVAD